MFIGRILCGIWDEGTIILKGMPKDFVLSARSLVVLETEEYEKLVEALKKYGDHETGCVKGDACNCGFEQALEGEK